MGRVKLLHALTPVSDVLPRFGGKGTSESRFREFSSPQRYDSVLRGVRRRERSAVTAAAAQSVNLTLCVVRV